MNRLHVLTLATGEGGRRPESAAEVTALDLRSTQVSDTGLKELAPLTDLKSLHLTHSGVSETGVKELAPFRKLRQLRLGRMNDRTLRALREVGLLHALGDGEDGRMPGGPDEVVSLNLGHTDVTDGGLKELAGLGRLRTLDLRFTGVTDAGMKELRRFADLKHLGLTHTDVGVLGLEELPRLTSLETLDLMETRVRVADLMRLASLGRLKELNVAGLRGGEASDEAVRALQQALPGCRIDR
jgi:hypothetical protein